MRSDSAPRKSRPPGRSWQEREAGRPGTRRGRTAERSPPHPPRQPTAGAWSARRDRCGQGRTGPRRGGGRRGTYRRRAATGRWPPGPEWRPAGWLGSWRRGCRSRREPSPVLPSSLATLEIVLMLIPWRSFVKGNSTDIMATWNDYLELLLWHPYYRLSL